MWSELDDALARGPSVFGRSMRHLLDAYAVPYDRRRAEELSGLVEELRRRHIEEQRKAEALSRAAIWGGADDQDDGGHLANG